VNKPITIWGGGGHGHVVIDLLRSMDGWDIAGIVDSVHPAGTMIMGIPVLGDEEMLSELLKQGARDLVVAVGDCSARSRMIGKALSLGFQMPVIAHPSAILYPSAVIGLGSVLCAGAIAGAGACIGRGVILNTRSVVDHDSKVGDFSHLAPGAVLCGYVTVGSETLIGAGTVVRDHLEVGSRVVIGAGSVIVKPVAAGQTVYGNPGRVRNSG
jgi:sugar O-acyltransferase (sialic acid O-acetyltransferase NeuD family)